MADETREMRPTSEGRAGPERSPTIFVTDAAAEGSRVADALRTAGYLVVVVALTTLLDRVGEQRPNVLLIDVDADPALDEINRLRRLPGAATIDFIYIGSG